MALPTALQVANLSEVHLANWFFDGARAEFNKILNPNPAFQMSHSFSLGSGSRPSAYNFNAVYASPTVSYLT